MNGWLLHPILADQNHCQPCDKSREFQTRLNGLLRLDPVFDLDDRTSKSRALSEGIYGRTSTHQHLVDF